MKMVTTFVMAALLSSPSQSDVSLLIPSPVSIVINASNWLPDNGEKVMTLKVKSSGSNFKEAKENAFDKAISQAIGTLTVSDLELEGRSVIKNETITASSGYVTDFEIIDVEEIGEFTFVTMDVTVKESSFVNRHITEPTKGHEIDGEKLSAIKMSYDKSKQGSKDLFRSLTSKLETALNVEVIQTEYDANEFLNVVFAVNWNAGFLDALDETSEQIETMKAIDSHDAKHVRISRKGSFLSDIHRTTPEGEEILYRSFNKPIGLVFDFGQSQKCVQFLPTQMIKRERTFIQFNERTAGFFEHSFKIDPVSLSKIRSVEVKFTDSCL